MTCIDCLEETDHVVEFSFPDGETTEVDICERCMAKHDAELLRLRGIFDSYLADGMTSAEANDAVIRLHISPTEHVS